MITVGNSHHARERVAWKRWRAAPGVPVSVGMARDERPAGRGRTRSDHEEHDEDVADTSGRRISIQVPVDGEI